MKTPNPTLESEHLLTYKNLEDIFKSLLEEKLCNKRPNISNRVLLDGRFFAWSTAWQPVEAEVLEISECAYKVRIIQESIVTAFQTPKILWIHKALVLAVLPTRPYSK